MTRHWFLNWASLASHSCTVALLCSCSMSSKFDLMINYCSSLNGYFTKECCAIFQFNSTKRPCKSLGYTSVITVYPVISCFYSDRMCWRGCSPAFVYCTKIEHLIQPDLFQLHHYQRVIKWHYLSNIVGGIILTPHTVPFCWKRQGYLPA